ncbi:MAG: poly-beta-1,6-N-acetyl-D-glucosamine biosynthesis protein PgaD [Sporomusaceae bacterium]|nr:poly-beta-1,6-N-acetyl-D-glucosamine biosynthesis protein PgaD [Sporomusaceae bacterium]
MRQSRLATKQQQRHSAAWPAGAAYILLLTAAYRLFMLDTATLAPWQLDVLTAFYLGLPAVALFSLLLSATAACIRRAAALAAHWPLPATARADSLVINTPGLKAPSLRAVETLLAISFWAVFLYLLHTLLTAIGWYLGLSFLQKTIFLSAAINGTLDMLTATFGFAILIFLLLFAWAQWNYWRYGRLNRRRARPPVSEDEIARYFSLPLHTLRQAQQAKILSALPAEGGGLLILAE